MNLGANTMKHSVCKRINTIKHLVYEWCGVIIVFLFLMYICVAFFIHSWENRIYSLALLISFVFYLQKHKLEELKLFTELFREFNERYDKLNSKLNKIIAKENLTLEEIDNKSDDDVISRDVLFDYFNLCAEEYLYYKKGYILPEVWEYWENGMERFFNDPRIKKLWEEDNINSDGSSNNSYYGFEPPNISIN